MCLFLAPAKRAGERGQATSIARRLDNDKADWGSHLRLRWLRTTRHNGVVLLVSCLLLFCWLTAAYCRGLDANAPVEKGEGGAVAVRGQVGSRGRRLPGSCQVRGAGDVPMCVPPSNTDLISPRALHLGFIYVGTCTLATVHRPKATVHRPQGRRYLRSGLNRPFLLCNVQWQWR